METSHVTDDRVQAGSSKSTLGINSCTIEHIHTNSSGSSLPFLLLITFHITVAVTYGNFSNMLKYGKTMVNAWITCSQCGLTSHRKYHLCARSRQLVLVSVLGTFIIIYYYFHIFHWYVDHNFAMQLYIVRTALGLSAVTCAYTFLPSKTH